MRLLSCTAKSVEGPAIVGGETQAIEHEPAFSRTGSGRTQRSRSNGLLATIQQRVKGAVTRGLIAALLIGGATGCASTAMGQRHVQLPQVQVQQQAQSQYDTLSAKAAAKLTESLDATKGHLHHLWRDTPLFNEDGTVNGYIEIKSGTLTKYELDMEKNELAVDRVLPDDLVGYPINYGFFPRTHSFDGDPYDVLVLGPPLEHGTLVRGKIVGVMMFDDEKGPDMKTVISPVDENGKPLYQLTDADKKRVGEWFSNYKKWEASKGKWSKVTGWGDAREGRRFIDNTHRFFNEGLQQTPEVKKLHEQASLHRPIRVLVTGFEPWVASRAQNMSGEVARELRLTTTSMTGVTLDSLVLPVRFEDSATLAIAKIAEYKPDLVLVLGESAGLKHLEIETFAQNQDSDGTIIAGGPGKMHARLDMAGIGRRTDAATDSLPIKVNGSPGVFVCNDLFYRLLTNYKSSGPEIVFAHLPTFVDATQDQVSEAVKAMLSSTVDVMRRKPEDSNPRLVS
jgi:inorganic pyrophosphatase/pyrrolidone-carboxylate peptidase